MTLEGCELCDEKYGLFHNLFGKYICNECYKKEREKFFKSNGLGDKSNE